MIGGKAINVLLMSCYCLSTRWFPSNKILSVNGIEIASGKTKEFRVCGTHLFAAQMNIKFCPKINQQCWWCFTVTVVSFIVSHFFRQGWRRDRGNSWQVTRNSSGQRCKSSGDDRLLMPIAGYAAIGKVSGLECFTPNICITAKKNYVAKFVRILEEIDWTMPKSWSIGMPQQSLWAYDVPWATVTAMRTRKFWQISLRSYM